MYRLKERTKEMASFVMGIDSERFLDLDFVEELDYVNNCEIKPCGFFPEDDDRIIGRGNPLLARGEFLTMDEVDKELDGE